MNTSIKARLANHKPQASASWPALHERDKPTGTKSARFKFGKRLLPRAFNPMPGNGFRQRV